MKILKISNTYFEKFPPQQYELLSNQNEKGKQRPYVVILALKYKNKKRLFAIPFRSNISNGVPKGEYFPLPPRSTTRIHRKHGLHYTKMFPVESNYFQKFHIDKNDTYFNMIVGILEKNESIIVKQAKAYIEAYENGVRSEIASKIDEIIEVLDSALTAGINRV